MPSVTLKAPPLPFLPTRVLDDESPRRTWRHPFHGKSNVQRSAVAAVTLPTGVVANAFRQPAVGGPAAIISAPLIAAAVLDSADRTAQVFRRKYPAAEAAVQAQRERTAVRAVHEASSRRDGQGPAVPGNPGASPASDRAPSMAALHDRVVLDRLQGTRRAVNLERWAGPPRTVALAGYAGAQAASAVTATSRLVSTAVPAASAVTSVAAVVGGCVAMPAQLLMMGVSAVDAVDGVRQYRQFGRDAKAVASLEGRVPAPLIESAGETLHRRRQYAAVKTGAAAWNFAGQLSGVASTVCTLSGPGVVAAPFLSAAGIVSVVGSIATSTVAQSKQAKFMGDKAVRAAAERPLHRDVSANLAQGETIDDVLCTLADDQEANQRRLVTAKLMSLVVHVLDKEDKRGPARTLLPHEREAAVEKLVLAGGRKGLFVRTSLLPAERQALQDLFYGKLARSHFFAGSASDVRARVIAALRADPAIDSLATHDRVRQRVMTRAVRLAQSSCDPDVKAAAQLPSGHGRRVVDGEAWDALLAGNAEARRLQQVAESRRLPREAKREAAATRVKLVGDVVDLAHTRGKARAALSHGPSSSDHGPAWL